MARKAKRSKTATKKAAGKKAARAKSRKAAAPKELAGLVARAAGRGGKPDVRLPVRNDPDHELLCKWSTALNQYQCKEVPIGGDWMMMVIHKGYKPPK